VLPLLQPYLRRARKPPVPVTASHDG
jgi:hypothetical protein